MQGLNVALVTGSSSGIGFETALLLAKSGFRTYATMRDSKKGWIKMMMIRTIIVVELLI